MSRLDDAIDDVRYILETLIVYRRIIRQGCCNTCNNQNCEWKPKLGEDVRWNCPHYSEKGWRNELRLENRCQGGRSGVGNRRAKDE